MVSFSETEAAETVTKPAIIHSAFPLMQTFKVLFSFHQTNLTFGELFTSVEKSKLSTTLLYHALADYVVTNTLTTEIKFPD